MGGVRECRALARAAWGRWRASSTSFLRTRWAGGAAARSSSMAAPEGTRISPLWVLEEALGGGVPAAGDAADAVAAEGTYYLERILPV